MRATVRWHDARPGEWSRGTKTIFNPTVAVTMAGLLPDVQPDDYEYDTYNKYSYKPFVNLEERQIFDLQQEEQFTRPEKDVFLYNDRENQAIPDDTTHVLTFDAHNGRAEKSPCAIDTTKEPYVDMKILTLGSASAKDVFEKDLRFSHRDYLDIRVSASTILKRNVWSRSNNASSCGSRARSKTQDDAFSALRCFPKITR